MSDTKKAAEILKESRFYDENTSVDVIALVIQQHLDELQEEALNNPEEFFKNNYKFWRDLDKAALAEQQQTA
jgi:hypothetical protein